MADKHGAHQTPDAWVVSLTEDFCLSPTAPVGYMICQKLEQSSSVVDSVCGLGTPILNFDSRIDNVMGNEAGIGGGVISSVNVGMCKPDEDYATTVRAKGQPILRHDTVFDMNCNGRDGIGNIKGKIVYLSSSDASDMQNAEIIQQQNPKKLKLPNGDFVEVYRVSGESSGYRGHPISGKPIIVIGQEAESRYYSLMNEMQHAIDDSRDGKMNLVLHKEVDGKLVKLDSLESEIRSDEAVLNAIWKDGNLWDTGLYIKYRLRMDVLKEARDKIKKGDFEGAREMATNGRYQNYRNYIEKAIRQAEHEARQEAVGRLQGIV